MEENKAEIWDIIISKYISIWVWSIIVGVNATITYRLIQALPDPRFGFLALIGAIIVLYGLFVVVRTWRYLLQYLGKYIIPKFIDTTISLNMQEKSEGDQDSNANYGGLLRNAFKGVIEGVVVVILAEILNIVLVVLVNYSNL